MCMSVCVFTPLELFGLCALLHTLADDDQEVLRENERNSLSLVSKLLLLVIQEVTEVDVEQLQETPSEDTQYSLVSSI